jgi:LL-diaminopimelate aminotransferase
MAPDAFYRDLIAFAREYGIGVLHDNAYSELVYDGAQWGSFLRFEGAADVGVEFNSLSKTYALAGPGWASAWATPRWWGSWPS